MNLFDLYAKISLDTSEYETNISKSSKSSKDLKSSIDSVQTSAETVQSKIKVLSAQYESASKKAESLAEALNKSVRENGEASKESQKLAEELNKAEKQANEFKDEIDKLNGELDGYSEATDQASTKTESFASKLKSGIASAGKTAATGLAAFAGAATTAVGAFLSLDSATEEYRTALGKIETAWETTTMGALQGQAAFNGFYNILGDTDTAAEATQLLSQLATDASDVGYWTDIAAGVYGTFGDSLPIEGLIEASNETAKVGEVTGSLADALNWVGISEDEFNEKLAACSDETERANLIMNTLSDTYEDASEAFYENNEALVTSRRNQLALQNAMAALGETAATIKNQFTTAFIPSIFSLATAFNDLINGVEGADEQLGQAIDSFISAIAEQLPQVLEMGTQILMSLISGIIQALPALVGAVPQIIEQFASALVEIGSQLLDTGAELLDQLTTGIETGLPDLISRLPQIIEGILNFFTEHLPDILQKGVEIIVSLINGIINSIPALLEALPQIITAIVDFVTTNLPKIVMAGGEILGNLIVGIIQNIPKLVAALPQIISAIVNGIINLLGSIVDVGKAIVQGIWQGITNAAGWLTSKITGWFNGVVDGVKSFLGIASPSKVFADIGKNMALGVGEGWGDEFGRIKRDIEGGLDFGTARVDWASSGMAQSQRGLSSALQSVAASVGENINIVVQSVLDGKVIGETAYQYSRNKARAYGV